MLWLCSVLGWGPQGWGMSDTPRGWARGTVGQGEDPPRGWGQAGTWGVVRVTFGAGDRATGGGGTPQPCRGLALWGVSGGYPGGTRGVQADLPHGCCNFLPSVAPGSAFPTPGTGRAVVRQRRAWGKTPWGCDELRTVQARSGLSRAPSAICPCARRIPGKAAGAEPALSKHAGQTRAGLARGRQREEPNPALLRAPRASSPCAAGAAELPRLVLPAG